MAIVIKVKADTKELEKDLTAAAQSAQKAINQATAPGVNKITEEFKRMRTESQALKGRLDEVRNSSTGLIGALAITKTGITTLTSAVSGATVAFVAFALAGSKLADTLLETAFAAGKTTEQIQKLEKGGRDLTPRLKELGSVLEFELIQKASKATDEFAIFAKQLDAVKILVAGDMANAFTLLGRTMNNALAAATPTIRGLASDIANLIEDIDPFVTKLVQASLILLDFERKKARGGGFGPESPPAQRFGPSPVGAFGPALTDEQIAFSTSPQGLKIAQQQLDAAAARERQAERLRLRTPRAARAAREAPISQEASIALGLVDANLQSMTKSAEDLFEEIVANNREIAALSAKLEDLRQRGYAKHSDAIKLQTEEMVLSIHTRNLETAAIAKENEEREKSGRLITQRIAREDITFRETRAARGGRFAATAALTESDEDFRKRRLLEQRQARGGLTEDFLKEEEKAAEKLFLEVREQALQFKEGIVRTFESAFREGFERGPKAFLQATASAIKSFFSQIAAELSTGIIELILFGKGGISGRGIGTTGTLGGLRAALGGFGGGGGGGGTAGGGGFGGGGGIGGFISKFLGGGGSASTIGVAPSLSGVAGGDFAANLLTISQGGTVAGAVAGTGGIFGGATAGLGTFAGTGLIGGLLGSGLGGKSTAGKILGGIGGGILGAGGGILGFTALGGVISGTGLGTAGLAAIGLLTNPFTLAIGGALLLGAYLLGKSKQRRDDEKLADSIWVEEREQVRQLIQAVNADRIDGGAALAQAQALRGQTVAQLSQIKTKSVRESRLSNQLRDLDNGVVAELRAAVERQARRRGVQGGLVPEFAGGGYVQGVDRGYDSVLVRARPGEVILNKQQQSMVQSRAGYRIFEDVGIQQFQAGGRVSPAPAAPESLHVTLAFEGDAQAIVGNLIVRGVETSSGQRAIVSVIKNGRKNGDL